VLDLPSLRRYRSTMVVERIMMERRWFSLRDEHICMLSLAYMAEQLRPDWRRRCVENSSNRFHPFVLCARWYRYVRSGMLMQVGMTLLFQSTI